MDIYNAWFDLKPGVSDIEFCDRLRAYMDCLTADGVMRGWRLMRRKLGLSAAAVGEFHLMMEFSDLGQLDAAFRLVGARRDSGRIAACRGQFAGSERGLRPLSGFSGLVPAPRRGTVKVRQRAKDRLARGLPQDGFS